MPHSLLGRDRELSALAGLIDRIGEHGGSMVVLGEPGVGKSALLRGADTPPPVSSRTVETGDCLLTPLDAPEQSLAFPQRRSQVNIARAVQHGRLRLIIPALAAVASSDGDATTHVLARATAI